ncbi:hypothetical protein GCM10027275_43340 [Rhabdobacter roseus]|uniref:Phosphoribosylformylglycinamidine synthase n=2 Tax=Rhabdobacter roseus TaxID=1655419 RepID=A0A840TRR4_9BACT|nr:hypothetical protein [Rhabdobacter roseus]
MVKIVQVVFLSVWAVGSVWAQIVPGSEGVEKEVLDSLFVEEVENSRTPDKVLHAEPLYIDLIRDLGARKGEREWNVGMGLTDNQQFDRYEALIEYEWAPANRLGLEVELPFTFYSTRYGDTNTQAPASKLDGIKTAIQWSFFVSEKWKTSLAVGYINELTLPVFKQYGEGTFFSGNVYNPFFVAAKRWGNRFHTLVYAGPHYRHQFKERTVHTEWQINTNFHYMVPGTRNFIGIEFNKELEHHNFDMVMRPQMRVGISENLLIGIVTGIPLNRQNHRLSTFLRLIYEPREHK